jgi:hypothetical protein
VVNVERQSKENLQVMTGGTCTRDVNDIGEDMKTIYMRCIMLCKRVENSCKQCMIC